MTRPNRMDKKELTEDVTYVGLFVFQFETIFCISLLKRILQIAFENGGKQWISCGMTI